MHSEAQIKAEAFLTEAHTMLEHGDAQGATVFAQRAAHSAPSFFPAQDMLRALHNMPHPAMSVVIPTCNRLPILKLCLAHIEAQTLLPELFEVIVVDDASTDDTPTFLASYQAPFRFRFLRMPERGAPARARNAGIRASRGHIVMFLNDDALLCPQGLQMHLETHRAVPDMEYSVLGRFSFPPAFSATPWGQVLEHSDIVFNYAAMTSGAAYDFFHYYTCNISTPRKALIAAGMFDPGFTGPLWGAEDIDIGYRLQANGVPTIYRADCTALHQHDLNVDDLMRMFRVRGGGAVRIFAKYKELPCHYRDIGAEDIAYWRNLPRRVTEAVSGLHQRVRNLDAAKPTTNAALQYIDISRFPGLQQQYYDLWKLRSNALLAIIQSLNDQLDALLQAVHTGTQRPAPYPELYLTALFLRWFYDTQGVCASELIHAVADTSRNNAVRPISLDAAVAQSGHQGRVLLACDFFWPSVGGTELFVEELGVRLMEQGYVVDIACRHLPERTTLSHRGMTIHQFACRDRFHDPSMGTGIQTFQQHVLHGGYKAVLALAHPDTWVCHGLHTLPQAKRPRVVMMPSMNAENLRLWQERGVLKTVQAILRGADAHITVSEHGVDADLLASVGQVSTFIPHAVTQDATPKNSRKRLGLMPEVPLLACIGNFWPVKNQLGLLQTLTNMPGNWQLVLAGAAMPWPREREYFMECWKLASRDPRIRITGPLLPLDAAALTRDANILLVPSLGESAGPLVVLQAMAHGVPWIATPECNAVHDEAGGLIAPLADFPAAIASLLENTEHVKQLGALGQEHWRTAFCWDRSLPLFVDCLEGKISDINLRMSDGLRRRNSQAVASLVGRHQQT